MEGRSQTCCATDCPDVFTGSLYNRCGSLMFDVWATVSFCGKICRNGNGRVWNNHSTGICLCVAVTKCLSSLLSPTKS